MLLDDPNDVEAIGDDLGVGEVFANEGAIGRAQIHADDADVFLALELSEVSIEIFWGAACDDIEDSVGAQVAEGRCELRASTVSSAFAMDGVFINAKNRRADAIGAFSGFDLGILVVESLDGSRTDALAVSEDTTGDTIVVALVDGFAEGFGGVAIGLDAREGWEKRLAALSALVAMDVDFEEDLPSEAVEVTDGPKIRTLAVDLQSPGLAPLVWGSFRSTARADRAL